MAERFLKGYWRATIPRATISMGVTDGIMQSSFIKVFRVLFFLASILAANAFAQNAAVVNGTPIPQRIVEAFLLNDEEALQITPDSEEGKTKIAELRKNIVGEQIDRALIAQETVRRKIAPTEAALKKAEDNAVLGMNTEQAYDEFLKKNHFTRDDYREFVLRSGLCGKALSAAFAKEISIPDAEVKKYFVAHHVEPAFQWPERVEGAHILIRARPEILRADLKLRKNFQDGPELEKAVADEIELRKKLADTVHDEAAKRGADFGTLARKYSDDPGTKNDGGNLGVFVKGTHTQALDNAFFEIKPGEVGSVVQTEYGFHIIRTIDRKPASEKTLAEATPMIHAELLRAAQVKKMRDFLAAARAKAKITIL